MITALVFLCLVTGSLHLSILELKVPDNVEAGSQAELSCSYELDAEDNRKLLYMKWWWKPLDADKIMLYQHFNDPEYSTYINKHYFNITVVGDKLILSDLTPKQSGAFECEVTAGAKEMRSSSDMTVFTQGSGPQISISELKEASENNTDVEPQLLVECTAAGVAPQDAYLEIRLDSLAIANATTASAAEDGVYNLTAHIIVKAADAQDAPLECELYFADEYIAHPSYVATTNYVASGGGGGGAGGGGGGGGGSAAARARDSAALLPPLQGDSGCRAGASILLSVVVIFTLAGRWLCMEL